MSTMIGVGLLALGLSNLHIKQLLREESVCIAIYENGNTLTPSVCTLAGSTLR